MLILSHEHFLFGLFFSLKYNFLTIFLNIVILLQKNQNLKYICFNDRIMEKVILKNINTF